MSKFEKAQGIQLAMEIATALQAEITKRHRNTPSGLFGNATKEHHQLIGGSRALAELNTILLKQHKEILSGSE